MVFSGLGAAGYRGNKKGQAIRLTLLVSCSQQCQYIRGQRRADTGIIQAA